MSVCSRFWKRCTAIHPLDEPVGCAAAALASRFVIGDHHSVEPHHGNPPQEISMITKGIKQLVDDAEAEIETISTADAIALKEDPDIELIDIRDIRELWREGAVPGARHVPRGMLEFWIDPESPYHKEFFASGKKFVFFCAGGLRSALAAQTAQNMGLKPVAHIAGGFGAWKEAGGPTEEKKRS
jgi:rhodanese-related sulfurtransferase